MGERINYPLMYRISGPLPMCVVSSNPTAKPSTQVVLQSPLIQTVCPSLRKHPEDYIRETAGFGLQFDDDVLREHCFHLLPYDPKYLKEAIDPTGLLSSKGKSEVSRNNASLRYKLILQSTRQIPAKLAPVITKKIRHASIDNQLLQKATPKIRTNLTKPLREDVESQGVFITENLPEAAKSSCLTIQPSQWDEYVMSNLSENTAHWIVRGKMSPGDHRDRMARFLQSRYGPANEDSGKELVEDSISEVDFSLKPAPPCEKQYKKSNEMMLEKVQEIIQAQNRLGSAAESEQSIAFYHLPTGKLQSSKTQMQTETHIVNKTAENVEVTPYRIPSPPTLKDILNSKVGDKYYHSTSQFVQDWLTGGRPIHQRDPVQIKMDSDNIYVKKLRKTLPYKSVEWSNEDKETSATRHSDKSATVKRGRGVERWQALPEKVEETIGSKVKPVLPATSNKLFGSQNAILHESMMTKILSEWRSQWRLEMHDTELNVEDLIREMGDLHVNVRIKAIVTCSRAAEYRRTDEKLRTERQRLLPEELFVALELCLRDENERVRTAAAIVLYSLERSVPEAEDVLRKTLQQDQSLSGWTAARCLACYGECDYQVVGELVNQLFSSRDEERRRQATKHLVQLSQLSTLVHSMIAERLNSCSWVDRLTACRTMSVLEGDINKDLSSKLSHMMWNDWHLEVRRAAARTLGQTRHGLDIHNQLVEKLQHGDERTKLDAISKLGDLGIMTTKLFPVFLKCFDDGCSSLRMEACVACMNLRLINDAVLTKLISLAANDRIWKVKALAMQALGSSGVVTEAVRKTLVWAFRYDAEEGVRAEACHAITALQLKGDDIVQILQDRYLVETSDLVKQEIVRAFSTCGVSPNEDTPILTQIKMEVKRLGTNENIQLHILANEAEENHKANKTKLIYLDPNKKRENSSASAKRRELQMQRLKATFRNSHHPSSVNLCDHDSVQSLSFKTVTEDDENDIVTSHIQASTSSFLKDYLTQREKSSDSSSFIQRAFIQREPSNTSVLHQTSSGNDILPNEVCAETEWNSVVAGAGKQTSDDHKDGTDGSLRIGDNRNSRNGDVSGPCFTTDENNNNNKDDMIKESKHNICNESCVTEGLPTPDDYSSSKTDDADNAEEMQTSSAEIKDKPDEKTKTVKDNLNNVSELGSDEKTKTVKDNLNNVSELGSDDDSFIY